MVEARDSEQNRDNNIKEALMQRPTMPRLRFSREEGLICEKR